MVVIVVDVSVEIAGRPRGTFVFYMYMLSTRPKSYYVPSARVQYKPAEVRTDSKVWHVLPHAVSVIPPFRVSRHTGIPNTAVMVISTTVILKYPVI